MEIRSNNEEAANPGSQATSRPAQPQPRKPRRSKAGTKEAVSVQPNRPGAPDTAPGQGMMHKGVYLSALIYVEGYQAPAGDFNDLTTSVLKKNLGEYFAEPHDGLTMTLKSVNVENNVEDEGEKFQF